jgi:hypothetical protein
MAGEFYVVAEHIRAGSSVVLTGGKLYPAGEMSGEFVGNAAEGLREGFRAVVRGAEIYEDDA